MMLNKAEILEQIGHKLIDKTAQIAAGIAKALITLICLGGSVGYTLGVKAGRAFYRNTHKVYRPEASTEAENSASTKQEVKEVKPPVDDSTEPVGCELVNLPQTQDLNVSISTASIAPEENAEAIDTILIIERPSQVNYLHRFVTTGLRDTLETNLLAMSSYTLPSNKRVKSKTHIRHGDIGVLKEYYPVLVAQGVLI